MPTCAELDESSLFGILLSHARQQGKVSDRADSATIRRMVEVFSANGRAAEHYRSKAVLHAGIDLIRATDRHPTLTNPRVSRSAWQRRTRGALTVHDMPGTHHDLIYAEHAPDVAALLSRELERTGLGVQERIERS